MAGIPRLSGFDGIERAFRKMDEIQNSLNKMLGEEPDKSKPPFRETLEKKVSEAKSMDGQVNTERTQSLQTGATEMETRLIQILKSELNKTNVSPATAMAIMKVESNMDPNAVSRKGAIGLMQIMPDTGKELGITNKDDLFDPQTNIKTGVKYYSKLLEKYNGNEELALAAYNAGPGNVARYNGVPPFPETQNYIKRVLKLRSAIESDLG